MFFTSAHAHQAVGFVEPPVDVADHRLARRNPLREESREECIAVGAAAVAARAGRARCRRAGCGCARARSGRTTAGGRCGRAGNSVCATPVRAKGGRTRERPPALGTCVLVFRRRRRRAGRRCARLPARGGGATSCPPGRRLRRSPCSCHFHPPSAGTPNRDYCAFRRIEFSRMQLRHVRLAHFGAGAPRGARTVRVRTITVRRAA